MRNTIQAGAIPGARFVDPVVLARVGNLELVARSVVDGFINGMHRSPYFGASVDFAEHRGYTPGDDIRRVDWKLFGRTDRFYVKEYEADSNSNFAVLLDVSKSMGFGSRGITKLDYGRILAGCLTYLVHRQRDRVGLVDVRRRHRRSRAAVGEAHGDRAARAGSRCSRSQPGQLGPPLQKLAEHFGAARRAGPGVRSLRGSAGGARRGLAASLPRPRPDRLPRARPGGDRVSTTTMRRRSRTSRAASRSRSCRRRCGAVPRARARAHRGAARRSSRSCASTTRCSTRRRRSITRSSTTCRCANRLSRVQVNGICRTPRPRRAWRARDSGADPPDSARAEARGRIPVADVPAADSVPVGAPAPHPATGRCCCMRLAALALIVLAFARPFFRRADAGGRGAERRARGGHPRRHLVQHGVRRSLDEGAGAPRADAINGLGRRRSRLARVLLVGRRSRGPLDRRSRPARRRRWRPRPSDRARRASRRR